MILCPQQYLIKEKERLQRITETCGSFKPDTTSTRAGSTNSPEMRKSLQWNMEKMEVGPMGAPKVNKTTKHLSKRQ